MFGQLTEAMLENTQKMCAYTAICTRNFEILIVKQTKKNEKKHTFFYFFPF